MRHQPDDPNAQPEGDLKQRSALSKIAVLFLDVLMKCRFCLTNSSLACWKADTFGTQRFATTYAVSPSTARPIAMPEVVRDARPTKE